MFGSLLKRLFARAEPDDPPDPYDALGPWRGGVIWVLRWPSSAHTDPMITSPPGPDDDVFAAYRGFARRARERLEQAEPHAPTDWHRLSMIGALRLTTGDVGGADAILDNLPPKRIVLDHGAGRGWLVPAATVLNVLPLPGPRSDWQDLIDGSDAQRDIRSWLDAHRTRLVWHEADGLWKMRDYLPREFDLDQGS